MSTQDTLVLDCLERLRPLVVQMARNYQLDQEDTMQEAAIIILETLPAIDLSRDPVPYLRVVVRRQIYGMTHRPRVQETSLQEPLTEDGLTLETLLSASTETADTTRVDEHEKVVHMALHRLPREEQVYMRRVYGLASFQPWTHRSRKTRPARSCKAISASAHRHLRADRKLASVWS